ncbi:hypothetical protein CAP35_01695 [Chitinophagaceae bacterium IBVUCB1]|nr:hypothetical protein CAP35_01695 [Chitinophagaceae bacterium IBVUCB1]
MKIILVIGVCCIIKTASAQRYPFYNLNVENGLIQSQVTSMVQDTYGHLWVGTLGGLSRYDGNTFTNFTVRDGMTDNTVNALATDKQGNIWLGTRKGISKYDGKRFQHFVFNSPENPAANAVSNIEIAKDGNIWCIAGGKLYKIQNGKSSSISLPNKAANVTAILPDGNQLWVACNHGVIYRLQNNVWDSVVFNEPQLNGIPQALSLYKDSRNRLWATTNGGLYNIQDNKITVAKLKTTPLYALPPILSITEDKQKNIWLGTSSGAFRLNDSSLVYCNKKNGLTDNIINHVLTDKEGNVWMATDGRGLYRFSGAQFSVLDETSGLPSAQIMSIAAKGGKVYLGTFDAGLFVYENGQVRTIPIPLQPMTAITAIYINNSNEIWLGTRNRGLWKYNGSSFKQYTTPTIPSNLVTNIYKDEQDRIWIGTGSGATYYRQDSFHTIPLKATVQDVVSMGADSIILATTDGLQLYLNDEAIKLQTNGAADSSSPQCLMLKGKELWIGSSDNGVICYNMENGKTTVINKNNGLKSDFIYNIIADDAGCVWIGTGYGIHKITATRGKYNVQFYGKEQGITGMESNHNAVFKSEDGSIWFGTTNGAVRYNPKSKIVTPEAASIVLQSVKLFGEHISDSSYYDGTDMWYKIPQGLRLPYKKNNITFTFQALTLSGTEQLKYRYRIAGLETKWSEWAAVNSITYSALPPGKYTLQVECSTGDSSVVKKMSYTFEIITPFHKTSWFRLVILAGCILLGITIQYIVNKRKQNRLALLERLRREEQGKVRQRTAEDFHDEVGNKLTRINVLTNVLKNKIGDMTPDTKRILEQIQDNTGQLYSGTRDILWSLKPANDNLYEILHRIRDFGGELFQDTEIDFEFSGTDDRWKDYRMPLDTSRNLIMIFKEALNNCLKYAGATKVSLVAELKEQNILHLELRDNGKGFDIETVKRGHGIDNINTRAKRLDGRLYIDAHAGSGTVISLSFKLPKQMS